MDAEDTIQRTPSRAKTTLTKHSEMTLGENGKEVSHTSNTVWEILFRRYHYTKSPSSSPNSRHIKRTTFGGSNLRVGLTPIALITLRCSIIQRRSTSVLMPAA